MFRAMRHSDLFQGLADHRFPLRRPHSPVGEGQFHILENIKVADQIEALKNESYLPVANPRSLAQIKILYRLAVEPVVPFRRRIQETKNGQERGFTAS